MLLFEEYLKVVAKLLQFKTTLNYLYVFKAVYFHRLAASMLHYVKFLSYFFYRMTSKSWNWHSRASVTYEHQSGNHRGRIDLSSHSHYSLPNIDSPKVTHTRIKVIWKEILNQQIQQGIKLTF